MPSRQQVNTSPVRTISDFKSKLTGGGARPNLFEVELAFPEAVRVDNEVLEKSRFLVKAAALPASTIAPIEIPFRGRILKVAGDRTFETWTITVINDVDFSIRSGAPLQVVENLQELEDDGQPYESIEEIWPDYPSREDFLFNEDEY